MLSKRAAAVALAVFAALLMAVVAPGARAASSHHSAARSKAPAAHSTPASAPARAPSGPPLSSGGTVALSPEAEASASASPSGGDSLVDNGLGSPLCDGRAGVELSSASKRNCRNSGFEAAQAPTGDYAFDVHINSGVMNWGNYLSVSVQDTAQWGWMLLVAIVHGVIVMLEWCYTVDLLESSAMRGVTNGLRETQATFTQPWLVLALAVAAVLAAYHGIVRRQVAETLGQVVLMGVMMLAGFWVIVNPLGTVGALGAWASEASLGTLGAVAAGTPDHPERTLAENMGSVFNAAIGGPWCYLEFGKVRWCSDPTQLDSRLHTAALQIAAKQQAKIGSDSAEMLRDARTNGELFLALPANEAARNSINESGSLFNVLCGGSEEPCQGPTAKQAEFRTQRGTAARVIGLFLIWVGVLGMVLLLGHIALYLLGAAIASLFLLLLAPGAVIAPALGDGGRAVFKRWAARLLGAVSAKLIYSFLLGVVLLMQRTLLSLSVFGWWAQWLLVSAMWWGLFLKRKQVLGFAHGTQPGSRGHGAGGHGVGGLRLASRLMAARELGRVGGMVRRKLSPPPPGAEKRQQIATAARERAKTFEDKQVGRSLEHDYGEAQARVQNAPAIQATIGAKQTQLADMQSEHAAAQAKAEEAGRARKAALTDRKIRSSSNRKKKAARFGVEEKSQRQRAATLKAGMDRLQGEIAGEQNSLTAARQTVDDGERTKGVSGKVYSSEQHEQRAKFLDAQAALPDGGRAGPGGKQRDYAGMANLVGHARREFEGLDAARQQTARLEIDRELALRREVNATAKDVAVGSGGALKPREQRKTDEQYDRRLEQRVRDGGHELPSSARPKPSPANPGLKDPRDPRTHTRVRRESGPVRDSREAATRRKRQLGRDRR